MDLNKYLNDNLSSSKVDFRRRPEVLLCANTVKPMHGVVPRIILGKTWWDNTRYAAYRHTGFHCLACGVNKYEAVEFQQLEGHEVYRIDYSRGRQYYVETVALCHYCHNFIHDGRLRQLLDSGSISSQKYNAVMAHGYKVLMASGINKDARKPYTGRMAAWGNWRLVLFGKQYPPKYKTYQDWVKEFDHAKDT